MFFTLEILFNALLLVVFEVDAVASAVFRLWPEVTKSKAMMRKMIVFLPWWQWQWRQF